MVYGAPESDLEREGRALVERLGGRWSGQGGGMCRCPAHDDRTPSLSVRPGRTRLLLHCFAGCLPRDILLALRGAHLLPGARAAAGLRSGAATGEGARAAAERIWDHSQPLAGTLAEHYLAARGLAAHSPELRFHPRVRMNGPRAYARPAMIAAVRDESGLVGIHRTFLDSLSPGLAPVRTVRRSLGALRGGCVRLAAAGARLGLAEGIETALSAAMLFELPCWAVLGSERFGRVVIPTGVTELALFVDHDRGGAKAESLARAAFGHIPSIRVHRPSRSGDDWNDVLRSACARPGTREEREREGG